MATVPRPLKIKTNNAHAATVGLKTFAMLAMPEDDRLHTIKAISGVHIMRAVRNKIKKHASFVIKKKNSAIDVTTRFRVSRKD
jgi:hypothetical protein